LICRIAKIKVEVEKIETHFCWSQWK